MEIKVKAVEAVPEKSAVEVEESLLKKHEEKQMEVEQAEIPANETSETESTEATGEQPTELKEEDVLSYIGKRYGKEVTSIDDLIEKRETEGEMPEDVAAFLKYKKETGRGISDFVKVNKDYSDASPDKILVDYFMSTEDGLDIEDVDALMADFEYDEDLDEEKDIKKKKLAKKRAVSKAQKYFEEQKEQYRLPLESSQASSSNISDEQLKEYKQHIKDAESYQQAVKRKTDWFLEKTDEVFNDKFKGFEFDVGEKSVTYAPSDATTLHNQQSDVTNFLNKFMDKDGLMEKPMEYHRALSVAMNPMKFAKFFYEQGKSDAVEKSARASKNIDMEMRRSPETTRKGGLQIRTVTPSSNNNGLRIRSNKRK